MQASIGITQHLWLHWAKIAIRQEHRAWEARRRGQTEENFGVYLGLEMEEAIDSVAAARHCLHNLYRAWGFKAQGITEKQLGRDWSTFTTATPRSPETWQARVSRLIGDRRDAVHHNEEMTPTQPHPGYPTNVGGVTATYTAERATKAVDTTLDVIRLAITAPAPLLERFAKDYRHVLEYLDHQRRTGEDW